MMSSSTSAAAPHNSAPDLRQRAARARDAAGRFIKRAEPAEQAPVSEPDPALAVVTVFRASWDALGKVLDAEAPDDMVAELEDAQGAAYDRLKAVRPTTPEGYRALAACWAMVLKGHRGDDPGETVSDHAADSLIVGASACVPDPPVGLRKSRLPPSLVDQIDLASASLEDLQSLHDLADRVGSFAYALVWTGRCKRRGPGGYHNAAGKLMQWLGDALTGVESAADEEARRRQPTTRCDRETRLEMLARPIIQNGDPDEMAAFARELLDHAAAEARGH
jgi:hypothetical protein